MATDTLTTITNFINSPPGQLVAGGVLAGIVWKCFERIEAILNDQTKKDMGKWLTDVSVKSAFDWLQAAFIAQFDRLFVLRFEDPSGELVFYRSAFFALIAVCLALAVQAVLHIQAPSKVFNQIYKQVLNDEFKLLSVPLWSSFRNFWLSMKSNFKLLALVGVGCLVPTFISLQMSFQFLKLANQLVELWKRLVLLVIHTLLSFYCGFCGLVCFTILSAQWHATPSISRLAGIGNAAALVHPYRFLAGLWAAGGPVVLLIPSLFTTLWIVLFVVSGMLLKVAIRFDKVFHWFNSKVDIEKKPLQSIGLVAGALVALIYWAAAIVSRIV